MNRRTVKPKCPSRPFLCFANILLRVYMTFDSVCCFRPLAKVVYRIQISRPLLGWQKLGLFNRMFFEVKCYYPKRIQFQWKTESSLKSQEAKLPKKIELQGFSAYENLRHVWERDLLYLLNEGHLGVISHGNSLKSIESEWWWRRGSSFLGNLVFLRRQHFQNSNSGNVDKNYQIRTHNDRVSEISMGILIKGYIPWDMQG